VKGRFIAFVLWSVVVLLSSCAAPATPAVPQATSIPATVTAVATAVAAQDTATPAPTVKEPANPTPAATATSVPQAPTATAAAAAEVTRQGGSLTVGTVEEPETLNPYITQLAASQDVLSGVMEGLLSFDTRQQLQPALAVSYTVSSDGLVYRFTLRPNVRWHDGQPFTTRDVVATWQIIMNPDFAAFQTLGWDKIVDIGTPDDYTAVMTTSEKYAPFLAYVSSTFISPKHLIDKGVDSFKQEFGRKPIGTGPFKFEQWESGQYIKLARNPDYWAGAPALEGITVKVVPDTNTLLVQLKTGEVQLTNAIGVPEYDEAGKLPGSDVILREGLNWAHIDLKNIGFLMDKRVRQALDYATPKQQIVDSLFNGLATVGIGDQQPGTPYANPNIQPRPYDLAKAAELLKQVGFIKGADGILQKGGSPLKIEYWIASGDEQTKRVQQVIAASWRTLGIDVDEREQDIKTLFGPEGYQFTKAMTAGQYEWLNADDPDDMYYWHSSQIPKDPNGTGGNLPAYFNKYEFQKEIDQLTEAGVQELDQAARRKTYFKIQEVLQEYVPVIFLYWDKRIYVAPKNLSGFNPNPYNALFWNVKDWTLTQ
jgi:peptide/nickel transport system substrate-binding protein